MQTPQSALASRKQLLHQTSSLPRPMDLKSRIITMLISVAYNAGEDLMIDDCISLSQNTASRCDEKQSNSLTEKG